MKYSLGIPLKCTNDSAVDGRLIALANFQGNEVCFIMQIIELKTLKYTIKFK